MAAKSVFEITDYFARGYNNVLGSVALRNKLIDVENAIKLANDDGTVTYDEIRNQLKKVDFSDVEIDVFFGISDVNGDGTISTDESNDMIDAMDDASSDEEFDEEDFAEVRNGSAKMEIIAGPPSTDNEGNAMWVDGHEGDEGGEAEHEAVDANQEELLIEVEPQPEQLASPEDVV